MSGKLNKLFDEASVWSFKMNLALTRGFMLNLSGKIALNFNAIGVNLTGQESSRLSNEDSSYVTSQHLLCTEQLFPAIELLTCSWDSSSLDGQYKT